MKLIASYSEKINKANINKNTVFFNDSLEIFYKKNFKSKMKSIDYLSNKKYLDKHYGSSIKYYEKYLKIISSELNRVHNLKYPTKYWEIILGYWLIKFIQSIYPIYLQKKHILKKHKFKKIFFSNKKTNVLINKNFSEYVKNSSKIEWFDQIIKIIFKKKILIKFENTNFRKEKFSIKKYLLKIIYELIYLITPFSAFNTICLDNNIYFPQKNKFKTSLSEYLKKNLYFYSKKKSLPILLDNKNNYVANKNNKNIYNINLRNELFKSFKLNNEFDKIFFECLKISFPIDFLEGYEDVKKVLGLPKKINKIFNVGPNLGEFPLINWIAFNVSQNKAKLYLHQIGGMYGTSKNNISEFYDLKVADLFFSWGGFYNSKNVKKVKSEYLKILENKKFNNKFHKYIVIICANLNFNYKDLSSRLQPSDNFIYIKNMLELIEKLKKYNIKNFKIKNYPKPINLDLINVFKRQKLKKKFINKNLYETLNETELVISTYNSTTFLELITINKPCLLYWDLDHWPLNNKSQIYFNKLKKAGIFHTNINSLVKKIHQISPNINKWWYCKKNQNLIKSFKDKFC